VKYAANRPFADPEKAAHKLIEFANAVEPYMDQRGLIELINGPFLKIGGSPAEYQAGLDLAIAKGWLSRHESGRYVRFTTAGASYSPERVLVYRTKCHHRESEVLASGLVAKVSGIHLIPFASSIAAMSAGVAFPVATSSSVLKSSTTNGFLA
jgi:hypothetical protein